MTNTVEKIMHNGDEYLIKDTTYSSLSPASGGADVSLVTTGEKYTWNGKQDALTLPATPTQGHLVTWGSDNETLVDGGAIPSGTGDMSYSDFNAVAATGATVTMSLNTTIIPSANFTVNAPSTIQDGQVYILRVTNGATVYTMTLGTNVTNPYSTSTTLTANGIDQFVFFATGGNLELQPDVDLSGLGDVVGPSSSTDGDVVLFDGATGKLIKDSGISLSSKADATDVNTKTFYLSSTSDLANAQAAYDWYRANKTPIIVLNNQTYVFSGKVSENISFIKAKTSITNNPNESYTQRVNEYLLFVVNSSYNVTMINETTGGEVRVLVTDRDYSTPYTPQYDGSPATKKYVDSHDTIVSSSTPTGTHTEGELWYDTTNDVLKVYDGVSAWNDVNTNTTYSAGTGLTLNGTTFSADTTVLATKSDIANLGSFEVVASLPSVSTADEKTIYLLGPIGTGADKYEEWIVTETTGTLSFTGDGFSYTPSQFELSNTTTLSYTSSVGSGSEDFVIIDVDHQITLAQYCTIDGTTGWRRYDSDTSSYVLIDTTDITLPAGTYNVDYIGYTFNEFVLSTSVKQWTKIGETSIDLSNYLAKDNTTSFTPSGDYNPATKKYVDDSVNTKTFYITSSQTTPEQIAVAQDVYDWWSAGKNAIVFYTDERFYFATKIIGGSLWLVSDANKPSNGTSVTTQGRKAIYFYLNGSTVTGINSMNPWVDEGTYLATNYNYGTPYTPQYDGSPATKKYVDDNIVTYSAGEGIEIKNGPDYSAIQGPAPVGYHVPLRTEWQSLINVWTGLGGASGDSAGFGTAFKIPLAGYHTLSDGGTYGQGSRGYYWAATPDSANRKSYQLSIVTGVFDVNSSQSRSIGNSLRCFKDEPVIPTSSWTKLYGTSIEAGGIFWSSTDGLISLSSDGTTWITILDKNLGATTVWNSGDTLSEANCGKYYQWGNNYGFNWDGTATTSSTQIDASTYGPGNYYNSSTFIMPSSSPYDRSSVQNDNLWGGVTGVVTFNNAISNVGVTSVNGNIGAVTVSEFTPSSAGTTGQVLKKTANGYEWGESAEIFHLSSTSDLTTALAIVQSFLAGRDPIVTLEDTDGTDATDYYRVIWEESDTINNAYILTLTRFRDALEKQLNINYHLNNGDVVIDTIIYLTTLSAVVDPTQVTQGHLAVFGGGIELVDGGAVPTGVPSGGNNGDVLTKVSGTPTWSAPSGGDVTVSTQTGNQFTPGMKIWGGTSSDYSSLTIDLNTLYMTY